MELNDYHKKRNKKAIAAVKLQQENPISYKKSKTNEKNSRVWEMNIRMFIPKKSTYRTLNAA